MATTEEGNGILRTIRADCRSIKGPKDSAWRRCVGACHAALNLREDWRRQIEFIHRECGFEYVRFHGLLDDDMEIYHEDAEGTPFYRWERLDALYDSIRNAGMRPFVELGFMPGALASGDKTIFFYKGNVTPPRSIDKWGGLIEALVRHCEERSLPQDQLTEPDQVFFREDLVAKERGPVRVDIAGVPAGRYRLTIHRVGYAANDLFDAYRRLGMPGTPDADQRRVLEQATADEPVVQRDVTVGSDGGFRTEIALRENDVFFIELRR